MPNSETNAPSEADLAYTAYVRASIERGLADSAAGRVIDVDTLRAKYGLTNNVEKISQGASTTSIKTEAHRLVDQLPANATWADLMYAISVQQAIERGVADCAVGRVIPHKDVLKHFGL